MANSDNEKGQTRFECTPKVIESQAVKISIFNFFVYKP